MSRLKPGYKFIHLKGVPYEMDPCQLSLLIKASTGGKHKIRFLRLLERTWKIDKIDKTECKTGVVPQGEAICLMQTNPGMKACLDKGSLRLAVLRIGTDDDFLYVTPERLRSVDLVSRNIS